MRSCQCLLALVFSECILLPKISEMSLSTSSFALWSDLSSKKSWASRFNGTSSFDGKNQTLFLLTSFLEILLSPLYGRFVTVQTESIR